MNETDLELYQKWVDDPTIPFGAEDFELLKSEAIDLKKLICLALSGVKYFICNRKAGTDPLQKLQCTLEAAQRFEKCEEEAKERG